MNVYLEIFGYIGTALVILSMTMKSINNLRVVNMAGAIISATYSAIIRAWPIVLLNVTLTAINLYHVIKAYRNKAHLGSGTDSQERETI